MTHKFAEIAFTDSVKSAQEQYGSRFNNDRLLRNAGPNDVLGMKEIEFIEQRDSFYMATVSETGWPYVQHRGGPVGFLKVLGQKQLAYGDFRGNTQLISMGNVSKNNRCSLILMDYVKRRRLKILGNLITEDISSASLGKVGEEIYPDYDAKLERLVRVDVAAFDWNCPQHITQRFTEADLNNSNVIHL